MTETTRTGPLVGKLVEGIQSDISDAIEQLQGGLSKIRALESHTKGVNGLSATLKGQGNAIAEAIKVLTEESQSVGRKMLASAPKEPITEHVNADHLAKVRAV